jgi:putative endonuclease
MTENMRSKQSYVYILASGKHGTLYVGVTSDIIRRIYEHKEGLAEGFTKQYNVHRLVYYEIFGSIPDAIHREKCIKKWNRDWKINKIEENNPDWNDLYPTLLS